MAQSTTDNYQLLTLKHCIISPVNTPTQVLYIHIVGTPLGHGPEDTLCLPVHGAVAEG